MGAHYDEERKSWEFVIDLPRGDDGKRKQLHRRGFTTEKLALRAEEVARKQFGQANPAVDGSVAAERLEWLKERELDIAVTTLGNYRNAIMKYIIPHIGARQLYDLTSASSMIFTGICSSAVAGKATDQRDRPYVAMVIRSATRDGPLPSGPTFQEGRFPAVCRL